MKITCGNKQIEAYPVEPFVYEVIAGKNKEFYQAPWDAFNSDLYMNNVKARIIKIPVIPISDGEIRLEILALRQGETRYYPSCIKKFEDIKPKRKISFLEVMQILAVVMWISAIFISVFSIFM